MRDYSTDLSDMDFPDPEIGPFGDSYDDLRFKTRAKMAPPQPERIVIEYSMIDSQITKKTY